MLRRRGNVLLAVRAFFHDADFVEVETPVCLAAPTNELHIDAVTAGEGYLRTSPELQMKRLLADGLDRVYQIGPCFRAGEKGRLHHLEFTMLEWYRAPGDYRDILADTERLLRRVTATVTGSTELTWQGIRVDVAAPWYVLTVRDAFRRHAGWDPMIDYDANRFDVDLVDKVEPALPRDRPVVLMDYPAEAAALARCRAGTPPVAERWELYVAGLELANAYSELVDAGEQRRRFETCAAARRKRGATAYPIDEQFLNALRFLPSAGGIALGVDRLVMLLTDATDIRTVRPQDDACDP